LEIKKKSHHGRLTLVGSGSDDRNFFRIFHIEVQAISLFHFYIQTSREY